MNGNTRAGGREPLYFGPPDELLFGCYHAPQSGTRCKCGVVLSYPMGLEYMRAHRAFMQLSVRLARAGFPSLRFDFYGCGDSSGEHEEAHLGHWLNDVEMAIGEIQRRNREVNDICLMGLRMGATLSAMAAAERGGIEYVVLWNPVVNGVAHRKELERLHREMLRFAYVDPDLNGTAESSVEIMGFAFSHALLSEIETIDLLALPRKPAGQVLLLDSARDKRAEQLGRHLEDLGATVRLHRFNGPLLWQESDDKVIVPHELWNCVVAWLSEVRP